MDTGQPGQPGNRLLFDHLPETYGQDQTNTGEQFPLVKFSQKVLDEVNVSSQDRDAVEKHLDETTWPSFFLSVENAREIFANVDRPWQAEDDHVLMSLPGVCALPEDEINSTFFWYRLPQECQDRRKVLKNSNFNTNSKIHWVTSRRNIAVANGEEILQELCNMRALLMERRTALISLRNHGNTNPANGHQMVSLNSLFSARKALDFIGWPGRYRDLKSFETIPEDSTAVPTDNDADSLHVVLSSCSNGMTWATMKAVFYPAVSDADWIKMTRAVTSRRKWSDKLIEELKEAVEKDELPQFAARHGRFVKEVELKAQRKFDKRPNPAQKQPGLSANPSTSPHHPYKVTKRVRRDKSLPAETTPGPSRKKYRTGVSKGTSSALPISLPASPEIAQSSEAQRGTKIRNSSYLTDEFMFEVLHYYISDAYNVVRLAVAGVPIGTISKLKLKGIYDMPHLQRVCNIVRENWEDVIMNSSWAEFEVLFKDAFHEEYMNVSKRPLVKAPQQLQRGDPGRLITGQSNTPSMPPNAENTMTGPARSNPGLNRNSNHAVSHRSAPSQSGDARVVTPYDAPQRGQQNLRLVAGPSSVPAQMFERGSEFPNPMQAYQFPRTNIQAFGDPTVNYAEHLSRLPGANVSAPIHTDFYPLTGQATQLQQPGQLQMTQWPLEMPVFGRHDNVLSTFLTHEPQFEGSGTQRRGFPHTPPVPNRRSGSPGDADQADDVLLSTPRRQKESSK